MTDAILETEGLTKEFRGFVAVKNVNLRVRRGAIHALIGPNGAGKTTCFNLLTHFLTPTSGRIRFKGRDITGSKPADIARLGLVRSFQISAVFPHLSVLENVRLALQRQRGHSFDFWRSERTLDRLNARALELLAAVGSSSSIISGSSARVVAISSARLRPYGNSTAWTWANSERPTASISSSARSWCAASLPSERQKSNEWPWCRCNAMRTFSSTVRLGNTAEIWNERTSPIRAIAAGREPVISRPL